MRAASAIAFAFVATSFATSVATQSEARAAGAATHSAVESGEYIADGGWGTLDISPPKNGGRPFEIESYGGNFHICNLDGAIVGDKATLATYDDEPACTVTFAPTVQGIDVSSTESCRMYCGARAGFDGLYLKPMAGCGRVALQKTRDDFKRLYDRKQYAPALAMLSPVPTRCARTLDRYANGGILNDIAIVQYKLGQRDACLRTLAPFEEEAAMSDDEIRDGYPPSDADAWLPIVKAARFNLGLCRKTSR